MNRKAKSKLTKAVAASVATLGPLDDPLNWMEGNVPCPWTDEQVADYQAKLNSAFEVENGIVLAWSYDRKYWHEVYMDKWDIYGEPIGAPQKTPILLFKEVPLNDGKDRMYISAPRFMLLEAIHGSQLEASWQSDMYVADDSYIGGRKRILRKEPPAVMYQALMPPLGTLAIHEQSTVIGGKKPCCERMWQANKSICYGKYKPPTDDELIAIKRMRERMNADGLYQRNDAERSQILLNRASLATKHFMDVAARKRKEAVRELLLSDVPGYMGDVIKNYGITMNATEIERTIKEGFKRSDEKETV